MRFSTLMLAPALLIMSACGGSGGGTAEPVAADKNSTLPVSRPLPAVSDVLSLVYDPTYQVPQNFYVDARAGTQGSYTMHHVLHDADNYELCTDDFQQALAWEEADNASRAVQGRFVDSVETDRYFEFARELSYTSSIGNISDITSPGFARVYKCSDTQRDGVDRNSQDGYAGHINVRPLSSDTTRVFAEYLWQFTFLPTSRRKVLDSFDASTSSEFRQTLRLGLATPSGDCDRIEVIDWTFATNRSTGATTKRWEVRETFDARLVGGSPQLCN